MGIPISQLMEAARNAEARMMELFRRTRRIRRFNAPNTKRHMSP